jgi:RNA polymerase sigma-70 factor (ECF subfamily)
VRECLAVNRPGVYQIQAAVNAVHSTARTGADTDWSQIAALYAQLFSISPTPVVALNRAVAVSELDGPAVGLAEVDRLHLPTYHAWHATRAELLRRLGRYDESRSAYDSALALIDNDAERAYLTRRRDEL